MVLQRDFGEDKLDVAEFAQLQVRAVAGDIAGLFEPLHADQARARRQADRVREVDIRNAALLLELGQDAQIDAVQLH